MNPVKYLIIKRLEGGLWAYMNPQAYQVIILKYLRHKLTHNPIRSLIIKKYEMAEGS